MTTYEQMVMEAKRDRPLIAPWDLDPEYVKRRHERMTRNAALFFKSFSILLMSFNILRKNIGQPANKFVTASMIHLI